MDNFFKDAEIPASSSSSYLSFKEGETTFRILPGPTTSGWEYWNTSGKPVRSIEKPIGKPVDIREEDDSTWKIKYFWAFPVWNYAEKRVQLLELTQKSIMEAIQRFARNPQWGDPRGYDLTVARDGMGLQTNYTVFPLPAVPFDAEGALQGLVVRMEALFEGGDPFTGKK